ncbi:MAG: class I SAM-dependent methyltransferase family protein [Candidatus Bathyarchaeia archaeon]
MRRQRLIARVAERVLSEKEAPLLPKGLDVVGDIAIVKIPDELEEKRFELAEALLQEAGPSIKVVLRQTSPTAGEHRVRGLEWLAGERRMTTVHREYGCRFKVELDKVYFSPRLAYERMRVAKLVQRAERREDIVNMFAGVGSFSIIVARHCEVGKVYSIDINPDAVRLMEENARLNKVDDRVITIEGDAREVIETQLQEVAGRVLMPLPERAYEYMDVAIRALKSRGWVHYYDFTHAGRGEDPERRVIDRMSIRLGELEVSFEVGSSRVVRGVGPNWYQIAVDIFVSSKP